MIITENMFYSQLKEIEKNCINPRHGIFGPDSMLWKISRETILFLDGPTCLYLQISQPKIFNSLKNSKGYEVDTKNRFENTRDLLGDLIFGDLSVSLKSTTKIYKKHCFYSKKDPNIFDSDLIIWVASTMIYNHCILYETFVNHLTQQEKDLYVKDCVKLLNCFGIDKSLFFESWDEFEKYYFNSIKTSFIEPTLESETFYNKIINSYGILANNIFVRSTTKFLLFKHDKFKIKFSLKEKIVYNILVLFVKIMLVLLPNKLRFLPVYNKNYKK